MRYTQISDVVLCDLLSSKSKMTDVRKLVHMHAKDLQKIGLLGAFAEIIFSTRYDKDELQASK